MWASLRSTSNANLQLLNEVQIHSDLGFGLLTNSSKHTAWMIYF
jgi:hypothetical protein